MKISEYKDVYFTDEEIRTIVTRYIFKIELAKHGLHEVDRTYGSSSLNSYRIKRLENENND